MYSGLALTLVAAIVPLVDRATSNILADHVRAGYPEYSEARVDSTTTAYLVYLGTAGMLGVGAWLWTIRTSKKHARRALIVATTMFLVGSTVALTNLFIEEETGDRALPTLFGVVGVLPTVPGLIAIVLLWKAERATRRRDDQRLEPSLNLPRVATDAGRRS
jgi:hypothetical protein